MNRAKDSSVPVDPKQRFEEQTAEVINRLFPIVRSWTRDVDLACDVVQEAACKILIHMKDRNWLQLDNLDAYLTQVARNCLYDLRRKQRNKRFVSLDHDPEEKVSREVHQALRSQSVFTGVDAEQLEKLQEEVPLQIILRGLSEEDLKLLKLYKVDELSLKEIAETEGLNIDSLRYRLNRIQSTIRYRAKQYLKATGKKSLF